MRGLTIAAPSWLLLAFTISADAITDAELEAVKRAAEYAKAKADIAEQQAREAKANVERMKSEKDLPKPIAVPAAGSVPPPADPKATAAAPKPPADPKKAATTK